MMKRTALQARSGPPASRAPAAVPSRARQECPTFRTVRKAFVLLLLGAAVPSLPSARGAPGSEPLWRDLAWGRHARVVAAAESTLALVREDALAAGCLAEARHALGADSAAAAFLADLDRDHPRSGAVAFGLGRLALLARRPAEADSLFALAATRFAEAGLPGEESVVREAAAWSLWTQGRYEEALPGFTTALEGISAETSPLLAAHASLGLGMTLKDLARAKGGAFPAQATAQLAEALAASRTLDLPAWEAEALIALSIIARWQNDLDRSLALRHEACAAYERLGDRGEMAACLQRLASIHLIRGDVAEAHRILVPAWQMARESAGPVTAGWIALNLGSIAYATGEYGQAGEMYAEAERLAREATGGTSPALPAAGSPGIDLLPASLVNLGILQTDQGRYQAALASFDQALELCRAIRNRPGEVQTLQNSGLCLFKMGDFPGALERLEAAASAAEALGGQVGLTRVYLARDIGLCQLELGRRDAARESMNRALTLAREVGHASLEADAHWGLALISRAEGRVSAALEHLTTAMSIREGLRGRLAGSPRTQSSTFGRGDDLYAEAIDILAERHAADPAGGFAREAYAIAQRARARSLLDLLAESEVDLRIHADPRYRERETALLTRISDHLQRVESSPDSAEILSAETARLEQELDFLGGELRDIDPRYGEIRYPRPVQLAEVQDTILRDDELLLEYAVGDDASFVWCVTREALTLRRLPGRAELAQAVREALDLVRDYNVLGADPSYFIPPVEKLTRWLLAGIEEELAHRRRIIVAPHDILNYLPFEMLFDPRAVAPESAHATALEGAASFGDLPFLIRGHDILYAPSAAILERLREKGGSGPAGAGGGPANAPGGEGRDPAGGRVLLIGDPRPCDPSELSIFAQAGLGGEALALPHARAELARIAELFPAGRMTRLEGAAANLAELTRVSGEPYDFVHFAVHGVFNERRPRYSGLLLSRSADEHDDGFLTLNEAFGLDLCGRQVVLSACASALGEEVRGEGLLGLAHAFFYSGAEAVVASLWPVSEEATAGFMRAYYEGLVGVSAPDRAAALAQAKRRMLGDGVGVAASAAAASATAESARAAQEVDLAHPFFWAPFVLIGSPDG